MAVIAVITTGDVVSILAGRNRSIVAGATRAENAVVIDRERRRKTTGCMAILTDVGRQDVRGVFASRIAAVVTRNAVSSDIRMIKNGGRPRQRIVAVVALLTGCDMCWCFTGRLHAVVTGVATSRNRRVVHKRNGVPCRSDVAVAALLGRHHVVGWFR